MTCLCRGVILTVVGVQQPSGKSTLTQTPIYGVSGMSHRSALGKHVPAAAKQQERVPNPERHAAARLLREPGVAGGRKRFPCMPCPGPSRGRRPGPSVVRPSRRRAHVTSGTQTQPRVRGGLVYGIRYLRWPCPRRAGKGSQGYRAAALVDGGSRMCAPHKHCALQANPLLR